MRLRSSALITTALAAFVVLASTAPAGAAVKYTCKEKSASMLFWPQGHGAAESGEFPEFRVPHLELYGGVRNSGFDQGTNAYADAAGGSQVSRSCKKGNIATPKGKIPNSATKKKATNLQCRFGQKVHLVFFSIPGGGVRLDIVRDGKIAVEAKLTFSGSSVKYNDKLCDAKAPPKN